MLKNTSRVKFTMPVKTPVKTRAVDAKTPNKPGVLTPEKMELFLTHLKAGNTAAKSAKLTGVSKVAFYLRRDADPKFHQRWIDSERIGTMHLEDMLYSVALDKKHKGFIPANIFMLKARKPEVYRDGPSTVVNNNVAFVGEIASAMQRSISDGG